MLRLTNSVGRRGANRPVDVVLVQRLLNPKLPKPLCPLKEDGKCGPQTVFAITEYQRRILHVTHPDGLIMPGGPTWRSLGGSVIRSAGPAPSAGSCAEALIQEPSVHAMLDVIGYSEGTNDVYGMVVRGKVIEAPNPADIGKVNVIITDFSKHPDMLVQVNPKITSTAAGRYQFLYTTWTGLQMNDFTPRSQDIACVKLFIRRQMISPLLRGDFDTAVQQGCREWASLPDSTNNGKSHYGGQPARNIAQLRAKYQEALAKYG